MSSNTSPDCYWPNHKKAPNQRTCNAGAQNSWCCDSQDICLDNGYCMQTSAPFSNRIGRGACTDSTWSSQACPDKCADVRLNNQVGLYLVFDREGGAFCCGDNWNSTTKQCVTGTGGSTAPFDLPAGNVIYNRSSGATITGGTLNLTDSGTSSNSSSSSTPIASSGASSDTASATPGPQSSTSIVPVAVGIAVPLGVLLIAALIACGILFRQNRRLRREAQAAAPAGAVEPKDNHYRQSSITSPAPQYESQSNWPPHHASGQSGAYGGDAHTGNTYYAKNAEQDVNAHEVPADPHIGELSADNRR